MNVDSALAEVVMPRLQEDRPVLSYEPMKPHEARAGAVDASVPNAPG
ncbi:MAG: hypothetical protein ACT4O5_12295 [Gammaproteobacteria bacterium]